MRRFSAVLNILSIVTVLVAGEANLAVASLVASVNNEGSTTLHEIAIYPGETFSLDINISVDSSIISAGMELLASASDIVDIIDGCFHSPWDTDVWPIPVGGVDRVSGPLAAILPSGSWFEPGSCTLASLALRVGTDALPGIYTLNVDNVQFRDDWATPVEPIPGDPGPDFILEVLPDPATGLLLAGAAVLFWSRRPRLGRALHCHARP